MRPTIVLVHGAFAESSSWDPVIDPLLEAGCSVTAVANPLRRTRNRVGLHHLPGYYELRNHIVDFLVTHAKAGEH